MTGIIVDHCFALWVFRGKGTHPPGQRHIPLEPCPREETGVPAKLTGKEDGVGEHKGVEEDLQDK